MKSYARTSWLRRGGLAAAAAAADYLRKRGSGAGHKKHAKRLTPKNKSRSKAGRKWAFTTTQTKNSKTTRTEGYQKETDVSFDVIKLGRNKAIFKHLGRWSFLYQNTGTLTNTQGFQAVADMAFHGHASSQYTSTTGGTAQLLPYQWRDGPFSLNPYQDVTGGAVITAATRPSPDRVFIETCSAETQITNFSDVAVEIMVYYAIPRRSTSASCSTQWQNVMTARALGQAASTQPTSAAATMVTGYPSVSTFGQKPEFEATLMSLWRILKKRRIILNAGATHKLNYKIYFNKILDKTYIDQQVAAGNVLIPGLSVVPFVIMKPAPVVVREGTDVIGSDVGVTIGTAKIGWVYSHRYIFKALGASRLSYNRAEAQFLSESGTNYEKIVNIVDAIMTNAKA